MDWFCILSLIKESITFPPSSLLFTDFSYPFSVFLSPGRSPFLLWVPSPRSTLSHGHSRTKVDIGVIESEVNSQTEERSSETRQS